MKNVFTEMSMEDIKMSDETRKKIVKFYKDDFKNFGYESQFNY